ncbi:uncharacterized protein LOC141532362 [Cotesia typhae]|uniref:uncharacterized protein LOC141532362 n=1 Tax=Cotesia typhae TaxID=2053667 RepID=UPI003D69624C
MPRECAMPIDEAVKVLKKYISFFVTESLPEWKNEVWKKIAAEPDVKKYGWSIHSIRTNVREDRRNLLTRAREECGYFMSKNLNKNDNFNDIVSDESDDDIDEEDAKNDKDYLPVHYKHERPDLETFDVIITRELWQHIMIQVLKENSCVDVKLRPKTWTHIISCEFWKQFRLKCAFIFKKGEVHQNGGYYATMQGKCKDKKCKNPIFGFIDKDPGEEVPVTIHLQCRDSRFTPHDDVYRPLQGEQRNLLRNNIKEKGVQGTRIQEASHLLQPGDTQCPLLFSSNVLYQLKKESINKEYNVKSEDRRDLIKAIQNMEKN